MTLLDPIAGFNSTVERADLGTRAAQLRFDAEPNLADLDFDRSVAHGLSLRPRRIASKWLYDEKGADLFEDIVASPAYYVPRAERQILKAHGVEIAAALGDNGSLVELGSGASTKVRLLLDAMPKLRRYVPVEISEAQLNEAAARIRADYPSLEVVAIAADFTKAVTLPSAVMDGPVMGFFPGSTLCNLLPENSADFLRRMHEILGADSLFLVGVDLRKDVDRLLAAYNAPGGAMWNFNLNILDRMNRELGTTLSKADFRHEATYNAEAGRIEAAVYPLRDQSVTVAGEVFDLPAGEPIVLEYSHKYTLEAFGALAESAGWSTLNAWTDPDDLFSVHLLTNRGRS